MVNANFYTNLRFDPTQFETVVGGRESGPTTYSSPFHNDSISFGNEDSWVGNVYGARMNFPGLFMPTTEPLSNFSTIQESAITDFIKNFNVEDIKALFTPSSITPAENFSATLNSIYYDIFSEALTLYANGERLEDGEWVKTAAEPLTFQQVQELVNYQMNPSATLSPELMEISEEINAFVKLEFEGELDFMALGEQLNNVSSLGANVLKTGRETIATLEDLIENMPEGEEKEALQTLLKGVSRKMRALSAKLNSLADSDSSETAQEQLAAIKELVSDFKSDINAALDGVSKNPILGHLVASLYPGIDESVTNLMEGINGANMLIDLQQGKWSPVLDGSGQYHLAKLETDYRSTFEESLSELPKDLASRLRFAHYFPKYSNLSAENQALLEQLEAKSKAIVAGFNGISPESIPDVSEMTRSSFEGKIINSSYNNFYSALEAYDASALAKELGISEKEVKGQIEYFYFHPEDTSSPREILSNAISDINTTVLTSVRNEFGITSIDFPIETGSLMYDLKVGMNFMYQFDKNLNSMGFSQDQMSAIKSALSNPFGSPITAETKALLQQVIDKTTADIKEQFSLPNSWVPPGLLLTELGNMNPIISNQWGSMVTVEDTSACISTHVNSLSSGPRQDSYINFLALIANALSDVKETLALIATSDSFVIGKLSDSRISMAKAQEAQRDELSAKIRRQNDLLINREEAKEAESYMWQVVKEVALIAVVVIAIVAVAAVSLIFPPLGMVMLPVLELALAYVVTQTIVQEAAANGFEPAQAVISFLNGKELSDYKKGDSAAFIMGGIKETSKFFIDKALSLTGMDEEARKSWTDVLDFVAFVGTMILLNVLMAPLFLVMAPVLVTGMAGAWLVKGLPALGEAITGSLKLMGVDPMAAQIIGMAVVIAIQVVIAVIFFVVTLLVGILLSGPGGPIAAVSAAVGEILAAIGEQLAEWGAAIAAAAKIVVDTVTAASTAAVTAAQAAVTTTSGVAQVVNYILLAAAKIFQTALQAGEIAYKVIKNTVEGLIKVAKFIMKVVKQINKAINWVKDKIKSWTKAVGQKSWQKLSPRFVKKLLKQTMEQINKKVGKLKNALGIAQNSVSAKTESLNVANIQLGEAQATYAKALADPAQIGLVDANKAVAEATKTVKAAEKAVTKANTELSRITKSLEKAEKSLEKAHAINDGIKSAAELNFHTAQAARGVVELQGMGGQAALDSILSPGGPEDLAIKAVEQTQEAVKATQYSLETFQKVNAEAIRALNAAEKAGTVGKELTNAQNLVKQTASQVKNAQKAFDKATKAADKVDEIVNGTAKIQEKAVETTKTLKVAEETLSKTKDASKGLTEEIEGLSASLKKLQDAGGSVDEIANTTSEIAKLEKQAQEALQAVGKAQYEFNKASRSAQANYGFKDLKELSPERFQQAKDLAKLGKEAQQVSRQQQLFHPDGLNELAQSTLDQTKSALRTAEKVVDEATDKLNEAREKLATSVEKARNLFNDPATAGQPEKMLKANNEVAKLQEFVDKAEEGVKQAEKLADNARQNVKEVEGISKGLSNIKEVGAKQLEAGKRLQDLGREAKLDDFEIGTLNKFEQLCYKLKDKGARFQNRAKELNDSGLEVKESLAAFKQKGPMNGEGKALLGALRNYRKATGDAINEFPLKKLGGIAAFGATAAAQGTSTYLNIVQLMSRREVLLIQAKMAELNAEYEPIIQLLGDVAKQLEDLLNALSSGAEEVMSGINEVSETQNAFWRKLTEASTELAGAL